MKPLKTKELNREVALETGASPEEVEAVMSYYWSEVRDALTQMTDVRIHLTNLGDFTLKHWLLDKYIEKYESIGKYTKVKGVKGQTISIQVNEKLNILRRMKGMVEEEQQRKAFIKQHKQQSHEVKQTQCYPYLEEQGSDPGRD